MPGTGSALALKVGSLKYPLFPVGIDDGATWLDTVEVNQKANGGRWIVPGTYAFNGIARVVIISEGNCTTNADAVSFVQ